MNIATTLAAPSTPAIEIETPVVQMVGIVGAGQMGSGIAHVCALSGLAVHLADVRPDALEKAVATIGRNMDRQVAKGAVTAEDKDAALARITSGSDYALFDDCDLVIEAATEKEEVKRSVFKALIPHLKPSCILATNTSSISITRLGASTDRPEKFIGMHFMNPVPVMKLVEVIRGIATDEPTFQAVQDLAHKLGKITSVAEDFPAFIVNRILVPMINEAVYALYEGVGSVTAIDGAMRLGANHPMGRWSWPTSSASTPASASCRCSTRGCRTASIAPARSGEVCRGGMAGPQGRPRVLRLHRHAAAPDALGLGTGWSG